MRGSPRILNPGKTTDYPRRTTARFIAAWKTSCAFHVLHSRKRCCHYLFSFSMKEVLMEITEKLILLGMPSL